MTIHMDKDPPLQYGRGETGTKNLEYFFRYEEDIYQEIENKRDFGFEGFWSSVGGSVGIFLGCSLLQAAELLLENVARITHFLEAPFKFL